MKFRKRKEPVLATVTKELGVQKSLFGDDEKLYSTTKLYLDPLRLRKRKEKENDIHEDEY